LFCLFVFQNNEISEFKRGTFHSQANPELSVLDLSFNHINSIPYDTFRFPRLERLLLDDNRIEHIDSKAIVEMPGLRYLSMEGNRIRQLPEEAFQNLHYLSKLNLAYNELWLLDFAAFDSVGTLSHLSIDLSFNKLQALRVNRTTSYATSSNIMKLDLSSNNISFVEVAFFHPVQNVLKILNLSRNMLTEINPESLGHLRKLHSIDLSHNLLVSIVQGTFFASKKLQEVYLNNNALSDLNPGLFGNHRDLRMVDLSWNHLSTLPEQMFQRTSLEIFRATNNRLNEIPIKTLNPVQSTLKHLDLTGNRITTISDSQLNQIQSLVVLNLAHNQITNIDDQAFCCLPSLVSLDLSFNPLKRVDAGTFAGVRAHLQVLKVANASLTLLPSFQLPLLKSLNVSSNHLTFVPPNTLANLSEVRDLDLSHNELPAPPSSAWHSMHHLRTLSLAGNPITNVMNDSFLGLDKLEFLDISDIKAIMYQVREDLESHQICKLVPTRSRRRGVECTTGI
jgi:Leucine-rich repeat (LRR) protein